MKRQSGMVMVEALVASALLGLGLLGAARLTGHALSAAMQSRQEAQAQALAADALDCVLVGAEPCPATASSQRLGVDYSVQVQRTPLAEGLTQVQVLVRWTGVRGPRSLDWRTRVSAMPDWVGVSSP